MAKNKLAATQLVLFSDWSIINVGVSKISAAKIKCLKTDHSYTTFCSRKLKQDLRNYWTFLIKPRFGPQWWWHRLKTLILFSTGFGCFVSLRSTYLNSISVKNNKYVEICMSLRNQRIWTLLYCRKKNNEWHFHQNWPYFFFSRRAKHVLFWTSYHFISAPVFCLFLKPVQSPRIPPNAARRSLNYSG